MSRRTHVLALQAHWEVVDVVFLLNNGIEPFALAVTE